ncbi:MAG: rhodanese-like domain-containing protein [Pseudomonadota bacterium]
MRYLLSILFLCSASVAFASGVNITPELSSVDITHEGQKVTIQRNQNPDNKVNPAYAKTSRDCPPFCIQPIELAPGVETIGELELVTYLTRKEDGDKSIMVIDSRTPDWVKRGTIPGSVNIPWTKLSPSAGADPFEIAEIFEQRFAVIEQEGFWNFESAKTLVLFCNGMWCGQSPTNIKTLLKFGYPAHKIKWYRGGMQNWENLGLTVVK